MYIHRDKRWLATLMLLVVTCVASAAQQTGGRPMPERQQRAAGEREKRAWGPEQATGAPDTPEAGDRPTAWAPLETDLGTQWLEASFERPVQIAEIRITETLNPGAVVKVSAITADGKEEVVWVGNDLTAEAPDDFVVNVQQDVTAGKVKIYVDTTLTPGWEEIDAVELVGKDGSRQWASTATASSTYAEGQRGNIAPFVNVPAPVPFAQLQGRRVSVHMEGDKTVTGTFTEASGNVMTVQGATTIIVNVNKIVYIEVGP